MPSKAQRTLLTKKKREKFIGALADGMSVTSAARHAGIARAYTYEVKNLDPEFAAAWDDATEQAADLLEDAVRQRALGQTEPIVYKGEVTGEVVRRSDILAMFLLKAKRPEFKDNAKVDVTVQADKLAELTAALQAPAEEAEAKDEPAQTDTAASQKGVQQDPGLA